jgi:hypothetical protein
MQLVDWLMQDMQPAYDAWSAVWASAPPTIVQSANELIAHCSEVIGAVGHPEPTERVQKVRTLILGVQRDAVSDTRFQENLEALGAARRRFAALVRAETGIPISSPLSV